MSLRRKCTCLLKNISISTSSPKYKDEAEATGLSVMQVGRVVNQLIHRKMLQRISAKQGLVLPKSTQSEAHQ